MHQFQYDYVFLANAIYSKVLGAEYNYGKAVKSSNVLIVDGQEQVFPAVLIEDFNWLKLRDVAMILDATNKQFSVSFDEGTNTIVIVAGAVYSAQGNELADTLGDSIQAMLSSQMITVNGAIVSAKAYNIDGFNYFRLRDLADLLDFEVKFDAATGAITLGL